MGKPLGYIKLYEVAAESADLGELRVKARRELRISLILNAILTLTGLAMLFSGRGELLFKVILITFSVGVLLICLLNLRSLSHTSGRRLIKTDGSAIKDCIGIITLNDRITEYPYSQMRQCTKSAYCLSIEMADGRTLNIPLKAFAHRTDFDTFAEALTEENNVPIIDQTELEAASAT